MSNAQNYDSLPKQFELKVLGLVCGVEVCGTVRFQVVPGSFRPDQLHKASLGLGAKEALFWRPPEDIPPDMDDPLTIMKMILSDGKWRPDGSWPPEEGFAKYSPDQPRAPEGTSIGGRWVKEGEAGGTASINLQAQPQLMGRAGHDRVMNDYEPKDPQGPSFPNREGKGDAPWSQPSYFSINRLPKVPENADFSTARPATYYEPPEDPLGERIMREMPSDQRFVLAQPHGRSLPNPQNPGYGLSQDYTMTDALFNFRTTLSQKNGVKIPTEIADDICEAAVLYNIDPAILASIINAEASKYTTAR